MEYEIRFNTIKEVEHLPEEVSNAKKTAERNYEKESIRTWNELEKAEAEDTTEAIDYRGQCLTHQDDDYSF